MLTKGIHNRDNVSRTSHASRRNSAKSSQISRGSRYKEKAHQYYTSFGGKHKPSNPALSREPEEPMTPQQNQKLGPDFFKNATNFYIKNKKLDENTLKLKSINYLDKKGILQDKINKRYYKDNDLAKHLKVDRKQ